MPNWPLLPNIEFLDDHEEQHAAAVGFGLGILAGVIGYLPLLVILLGASTYFVVRSRPERSEEQDLWNDLLREPHYFVGFVGLGIFLGLGFRTLIELIMAGGLPA